MLPIKVLLNYVSEYRFSFDEEAFYEQNPEEHLRRQFMDTSLIKAFYIQRIAGQWAKKSTSPKFGRQFVGLTLKDFELYDTVKCKGSGKVAAIDNPVPNSA